MSDPNNHEMIASIKGLYAAEGPGQNYNEDNHCFKFSITMQKTREKSTFESMEIVSNINSKTLKCHRRDCSEKRINRQQNR